MKHYTGYILAFGLLANSTVQALDLAQVYSLAQDQDIQLQIAASNLRSTEFGLSQILAENKPLVSLSANGTLADQNNSYYGDDWVNSYGFTVSLTQSLYNKKILSQSGAAEASISQSEADYQSAQQDLIVRTTEAYFNVLSAQDNNEFAAAEKNAIGRQLEQAKKRFEVGLIAITDVKEAQASYDLTLSQEISANNAFNNALEALTLITGQTINEPLKALGSQVDLIIPTPENKQAWVDQAQKNNLSLVSAEAALKAANENRGIAKAGNDPTVDLLASYANNQLNYDVKGGRNTSDLTVSVQLNMPLYTGGRNSAAISQAEANYATAQSNLYLQKRLITQQANNTYLAVVSGIAQVNALKQALISTTAALEATEAGFDVGTRTSVDVLNSLREKYRSQRDYASARYSYLINTLKLKQAASLLSTDDISIINQWLEH